MNFQLKKLENTAKKVYDIQVKDTHSFTVGKSNMIVHNCYLNWIPDTSEGLVDTLSETNWLSMMGGGVGVGFGIRSAGDKSTGVMPHLKMYDASSLAYRQGKTRRGSYAAYLDIDHPDILLFLEMRKPTGDQNFRCMNLHHGINIPDAFMKIIENCLTDPNANDDWELKEPHSAEVREVVSAMDLWQRILEMRMQTGEPYLHFIDRSNEMLPQFLKDRGLKVRQSNLCSEITLPTDNERTAVCCLSSVNLEYFYEWSKNPQFLHDVLEMLDNVLERFIRDAPESIARAKYSAMRERSVGVGALGFHAFLQKHNVPFESAMAKSYNLRMFKHINDELKVANLRLGAERGEAPDAVGSGQRMSHTQAIAPNASSSIIMGNTSPSIEPWRANAYRQDTLSGAYLNKNKFLDALIKRKMVENPAINYDKVWSSIISSDGSVQHLKILNDWEKDIYKTAMEIDQRWVIEHAADRQKFIDQSQSLNVFFRPDTNITYLHIVHFLAWKMGLKTMYYCRSEKISKADKLSRQIERKVLKEVDMAMLADMDESSCIACEG
jgi:ribonucleoside-diphosphate reductase alpha chain